MRPYALSRSADRILRFLPPLIGVDAAVMCIAPRMTVTLLLVTGAAIGALAFAQRDDRRLAAGRELWAFVCVTLALSAYLCVNATWSQAPVVAYEKVGVFLGAVTLAVLSVKGSVLLPQERVRAARRAILIGGTIGLAFVLFELLSDQAIRRFVMTWAIWLRPGGGKHLTVVDGVVTEIGRYRLNWNVAMAAMAVWPVMAALSGFGKTVWVRAGGFALFGLTFFTAFISEHQTSDIAILIAALAYCVARRAPRISGTVLAAGWCLAFLAIVPAAHFAFETAHLQNAQWLPWTARARIILWDYTASQVPKALWGGVGIRSTRVLDTEHRPEARKPDGYVYALRTGRHSHDVYLQTWYELGLIGVAFFMVWGVLVIRFANRIVPPLRAYAQAMLAGIFALAAFSWGMWQTWFICAFALLAILVTVATRGGGHVAEVEKVS